MKTLAEAVVFLEEIAQGDPDNIAAYLRSLGIKGNACRAYSCPLSRYFESVTGSQVAVSPWCASARETSYPLGNTLSDFIHAFDNDFYPWLVENV